MAAGKYNFTIIQGSTFRRHFEWTDSNGDPWDWADFGVRAQIRLPTSSPTILFEFNTDNGRIILSPGGLMDWHFGADATAVLSWSKLANWDLEFYRLSDPTEVDRKLEGTVGLSFEVTR